MCYVRRISTYNTRKGNEFVLWAAFYKLPVLYWLQPTKSFASFVDRLNFCFHADEAAGFRRSISFDQYNEENKATKT